MVPHSRSGSDSRPAPGPEGPGRPPLAPETLYAAIAWPEPPAHRPYVAMNMVATVDGKSLPAARGATARGLGGPTDQRLMRRLEASVDAVCVGAGTLRAGQVIYEPRLLRVAFTRSGNLPAGNRFFTDAPGRALVVAPPALAPDDRARIAQFATLLDADGPAEALARLRGEFGVRTVLLEGGATLNFAFIEAELVDEVFLTVAPRIKGGSDLPTVVDGPGLPGYELVELTLVSVYEDTGELYLRYRVEERRDARTGAPTGDRVAG